MCKSYPFALDSGGDEENRTPDPLLARQVLSQLSYTPIFQCKMQIAECRMLLGLIWSGKICLALFPSRILPENSLIFRRLCF